MPTAWLAPLLLLAPPAPESVSFRREVIPALTRAGCNAGACHGTPTGKNGFRLSLRGYDPSLDHHTLTREFAGRRTDRHAPDASLLLTKATARTPHEGGRRLDPDGTLYHLVRGWIEQGASDDAASPPTALDVPRPEPPAMRGPLIRRFGWRHSFLTGPKRTSPT